MTQDRTTVRTLSVAASQRLHAAIITETLWRNELKINGGEPANLDGGGVLTFQEVTARKAAAATNTKIEQAFNALAVSGYVPTTTGATEISIDPSGTPLKTDTLPEAEQSLLDQMLTGTENLSIEDWLHLGRAIGNLAEADPEAAASAALTRTWMSHRPDDVGSKDVVEFFETIIPNHHAAVAAWKNYR